MTAGKARKARKEPESYGVEIEARIERVKILVGKYIVYKDICYSTEWIAWLELYKIYEEMSGEEIVTAGRRKKRSYIRTIAADGGLETLERAARKLAENCMDIESRREETMRLALEALQDIRKEKPLETKKRQKPKEKPVRWGRFTGGEIL